MWSGTSSYGGDPAAEPGHRRMATCSASPLLADPHDGHGRRTSTDAIPRWPTASPAGGAWRRRGRDRQARPRHGRSPGDDVDPTTSAEQCRPAWVATQRARRYGDARPRGAEPGQVSVATTAPGSTLGDLAARGVQGLRRATSSRDRAGGRRLPRCAAAAAQACVRAAGL